MRYDRPISAAAAARDRSGVNHISRLVELWLKNLELAEAITTVKTQGCRHSPPVSGSDMTASIHVPEKTTRAARTDRKSSSPRKPVREGGLPVGETQTTFSFYQPTK